MEQHGHTRLVADFEGTNTRMGDAESGLKLNILCEYFHRYWGKKTIIILDEYPPQADICAFCKQPLSVLLSGFLHLPDCRP